MNMTSGGFKDNFKTQKIYFTEENVAKHGILNNNQILQGQT